MPITGLHSNTLTGNGARQNLVMSSFEPYIRDGSGAIDFQEFKNVFSSTIGPDSIPFNFDWYSSLFNLVLHQ
jgi:hypothetical protein